MQAVFLFDKVLKLEKDKHPAAFHFSGVVFLNETIRQCPEAEACEYYKKLTHNIDSILSRNISVILKVSCETKSLSRIRTIKFSCVGFKI